VVMNMKSFELEFSDMRIHVPIRYEDSGEPVDEEQSAREVTKAANKS
jgi:hypothetical protein